MAAERRVRPIGKFLFHNGLDVRGARCVSAKGNSGEEPASIGKGSIQPARRRRNFRDPQNDSRELGALFGFEHASCDARYETPRNKSLPEHPQIIPQPGDDITLACR